MIVRFVIRCNLHELIKRISVVAALVVGASEAAWGQSSTTILVPGYISVSQPAGPERSPAMASTIGDRLRATINATDLPANTKRSLNLLPTQDLLELIAIRQAPAALIANPSVQPFVAVTKRGTKNVGGLVAAHPAVALLLAQDLGEDSKEPFCTGTLVAPDTVLTAAHCVCKIWLTNEKIDGYYTFQRCTNGDEAGLNPSPLLDKERWAVFFQHGGLFEVREIVLDPDFSWPSQGTDIRGDVALLRLDRPVPWIGRAPLSPQRANNPFTQALGVGFGYSRQGASPSIAAAAVSPGLKSDGVMELTTCGTSSRILCTTFSPTVASAGICPGDSGGPLWSSSTSELVGVASGSATDPCEGAASTSLDSRLSSEEDAKWLRANIQDKPVPGPLWPPFARTNLKYVLDFRNGTTFAKTGRYIEGPALVSRAGILLGTINSTVPLSEFEIQNANDHRTVCTGRVNLSETKYVNWCATKITELGQKYKIVARADTSPGGVVTDSVSLQFVLALLPSETPLSLAGLEH